MDLDAVVVVDDAQQTGKVLLLALAGTSHGEAAGLLKQLRHPADHVDVGFGYEAFLQLARLGDLAEVGGLVWLITSAPYIDV